MEPFNLAQLTKEMVVGQLKNLTDPTIVAASVVRGTLIARLKGHSFPDHEIQETVREVCKGAVSGMVLMECPMARGAAAVLIACRTAGKAAGIERDLVDIAAVKGLADAARFVTPEVLGEMSGRLDEVRAGASELFAHFCEDAQAYQSHPAYIPPKY